MTAGNQSLPVILWYFKLSDEQISFYGQNGIPIDLKPCMGSNNKMGGNAISRLLNMNFYFNPNSWVNVDSIGKVSAGAITDEYREALKWVHDLMTPQGSKNTEDLCRSKYSLHTLHKKNLSVLYKK